MKKMTQELDNNAVETMMAAGAYDMTPEKMASQAEWLANELGETIPSVQDKEEQFFRSELETRRLPNREDALRYLLFRQTHDVYQNMYMTPQDGVTVVGVGHKEAPLFFRARTSVADATDYAIEQASYSNGLLLVHPQEGHMAVHPLMWTAFDDLCAISGLGCKTMRRVTPIMNGKTEKIGVLSPDERGAIFTKGLRLQKTDMFRVLIRDGMIARIGSRLWRELDAVQGVRETEEFLENEFPGYTYMDGWCAEDILVMEYNTNADLTDLAVNLRNVGIDLKKDPVLVYRFSTGETGLSAMKLVPVLYINDTPVTIPNAPRLDHTVSSAKKSFHDLIQKTGGFYRELEDSVEILGNTPVKYPDGCLWSILCGDEKVVSGISRKIARDAADTLSGKNDASAIDVYLAILDACGKQAGANTSAFSISAYIGLTEAASGLLFSPMLFKTHDEPIPQK